MYSRIGVQLVEQMIVSNCADFFQKNGSESNVCSVFNPLHTVFDSNWVLESLWWSREPIWLQGWTEKLVEFNYQRRIFGKTALLRVGNQHVIICMGLATTRKYAYCTQSMEPTFERWKLHAVTRLAWHIGRPWARKDILPSQWLTAVPNSNRMAKRSCSLRSSLSTNLSM